MKLCARLTKFVLVSLLSSLTACGQYGYQNAAGTALVDLEDFGDFYELSSIPDGSPGDLIRIQEVVPLAPDSRAWRVLYLSQATNGDPIAVSGLVAAPLGKAPEGGRPVVSWAHGTKGVNDPCAPSRGYRVAHNVFDIAPEILEEGWVAVSTDYEGLGTAGVHPYMVSTSEARGQLDIVRAAMQIPDAAASKRFAVWGRSQGGHAVLAAAEEAPVYAPELDLVGVIAAAPVGFVARVFFGAAELNVAYNWLMAAGMEAAWHISMDPYYDADAYARYRALVDGNEACYGDFVRAVRKQGGVGFRAEVNDDELREFLQRSNVGGVQLDIPVLVSQGTADTTVPKYLTDTVVARMCKVGTNVQYMENKGESHNDSSFLHMSEFRSWTRERLNGEAALGCNP